MGSVGVGLLQRARALLGRDERVMVVICPSGAVRRVLELVGVEELLVLFDSAEDAAVSLDAPGVTQPAAWARRAGQPLRCADLRSGSRPQDGAVISAVDLRHLRRCVELAAEGLALGDEPFGSVLVAADGAVLVEDRNRVAGGDRTRHPELAIARWAAAHLSPADRAAATVYTSGEHCPMCAAAHGWVGLGRIVVASSSAQLTAWLTELGVPSPPVRPLPIRDVVPGVLVEGPVEGLADEVRALHAQFHGAS